MERCRVKGDERVKGVKSRCEGKGPKAYGRVLREGICAKGTDERRKEDWTAESGGDDLSVLIFPALH